MEVHKSTAGRGRRSVLAKLGLGSGATRDLVTGTIHNDVMLNAVQVREAIQVARGNSVRKPNPVVRSAIEKLISDTIDGGFNIRLRYGNDKIELRESEQCAIKTSWPSFARQALWHLQVVGLVVVMADRQRKIPHVVPMTHVQVRFREDINRVRVYYAEDRRSNRTLDALVFVKFPPDEDGNLTSPVASLLWLAHRYDRVWENQDVGDHHNTRPVWAFGIDKQGTGRPSPIEHDEMFQGEVYEQYASFRADLLDLEREDFNRLKNEALQQYEALQARAARTPGAALVPHGVELPQWLNHFFLPPNQHLESAPKPSLNPHFSPELEILTSLMLQEFKIPPVLMESMHSTRFASQPEMAMKQWGSTTRAWQRGMASLLGETYMFVSADVFQAYAQAILGRVRQEREQIVEQTIKRTRGENTKDAGDARANGESAGQPFRNDDGNMQMPESDESLQRAARVICTTDMEVVEHLRQQFGVDVEFKCAPTMTYAELKQMYDDGLITADTFATKAAAIAGMSEKDFIISPEDRLADAKERRKVQEALEPPDAQNTARGTKRTAAQ